MDIRVGLYCFQYVMCLISNRFQCCVYNVVSVYFMSQIENCFVCIWVLVWCIQFGKCWNYIYIIGVLYFGGEIFGIVGVVN